CAKSLAPLASSRLRLNSVKSISCSTADHRIDGAVLQLIDFTELRRSLDEAKGARDFAQAIVDTVREPLVVLNHDLRIRTANRAFYATFHLSPAEAINQTIFEVGSGQWNFPKVHELLDNLAHSGTRLEDVELEHHFDR